MVVMDAASAEIELILVSDDPAETRQLANDLHASKHTYSFVSLSVRETLVEAALRRILGNAGKTPSVMVINHRFVGADCEVLLQLALNASSLAAIECVVTNPPIEKGLREKLIGLGARLFDGEPGGDAALLILH
jgi:hypothetical protein